MGTIAKVKLDNARESVVRMYILCYSQVGEIVREILDRAYFKIVFKRKNADKIANGNLAAEIVENVEKIASGNLTTEIDNATSDESNDIYASETSEDDENVDNDLSLTLHEVDMSMPSASDKVVDFFRRMEDVQIVQETDDEGELPIEDQQLSGDDSDEFSFPVENLIPAENDAAVENQLCEQLRSSPENKTPAENGLPAKNVLPVESQNFLLAKDIIMDLVGAADEVAQYFANAPDVLETLTSDSNKTEENLLLNGEI